MPDRSLTADVKAFARAQGADLVGVAPVESYTDYLRHVTDRLSETGASLADYMIAPGDDAFFERLSDARFTLPSARSIIILGVYAYDEAAIYRDSSRKLQGKIARTYRYYPVVRRIAESVRDVLRKVGYDAQYGQDVPLKYVANRIGLGSYGKNGILMTSEFGSYVGFRNILTDARLEPDEHPSIDLCGDCDLCLRACPTGALYAPYKVNACLCLNPVTRSENPVNPETRSRMRNWIIGCDICQEVCPVNRRLAARPADSRAAYEPAHHASHSLLGGIAPSPSLLDLLEGAYPDVIRRNAAIALGNVGVGRPDAASALEGALRSAGARLEPYVRWALDRPGRQARRD
jgi:epoxyqueuosine reductase